MSGKSLNAYQQRLAAAASRRSEKANHNNYDKVLEINWLLRQHEEVSEKLHGVAQLVVYRTGWFRVGSLTMQRAGFAKRIDYLNAQLHERELNAPED